MKTMNPRVASAMRRHVASAMSHPVASAFRRKTVAATAFIIAAVLAVSGQQAVPTPEQFFGFRIGADNKLARWDKIVDYMKQVSGASDRVRFRELGRTTNDNPFIALEISSPDT